MDQAFANATEQGLLLVGHGTSNLAGQQEMLATARAVAKAVPHLAVEPCFLEIAEPTIQHGVARLYERGVRRATIVPVLLFAAGHVKRDIPQAVAAAAHQFPDLSIRATAAALGCHDDLIALSARRFDQALAAANIPAASTTELIMVGRGSRDAEATAEMRRFTRLRCLRTPVSEVKTCFVAMASPSFDELLAATRQRLRKTPKSGPQQVVVQPHLLFQGDLLQRIRQAVTAVAGDTPETQWIVTDHLGCDDLLVSAILNVGESASTG